MRSEDFSSFSDENFDLKVWVNKALSEGKAPEDSVEQHASTLVIKLQLLSLELNSSLEEICAHTLISVPRSIREIEKVKKEANELKRKLDSFTETLSVQEDNTLTSLKFLSELDNLKMKLESVFNALKEAEKLSKINETIESVFATRNFQKIADELSGMQQSLNVLSGINEFNLAKHSMAQLEDRLEGLARPQLLQAFTSRDTDAALQFVSIFSKINRIDQLLQHYYKCRLVPLEQFWDSFEKQTSTSPRTDGSKQENEFVRWLPSFYDELLLLVNTETAWIAKVFPKELPVATSFVVESLSYLAPYFRKRIDTVIFANKESALEDLISLYHITNNFSKSALKFFTSSDSKEKEKITVAIFEPYFNYQNDYPSLERQHLFNLLSQLKPSKRGYLDTIAQIDHSISKLFLLAESSIERCIKFTEGSEGEGLVKTLNDFFGEYIQHLFTLLQHLREEAHLDISTASPTTEPLVASYSNYFDWNYFQGALQLLQIINKLTQKLSSFDTSLRLQLLQQKSTLLGKNAKLSATAVSCLHLKKYPDKARKLLAFFQNLDDVALKLLAPPAQLLSSFASAVHTLVFDTIFSFIKDKLNTLPNLEVWKTESPKSPLNLPTFSLAPLNIMTMIGENILLTLPQQLEPFADSDTSLFFDPKGLSKLNVLLEDTASSFDDLDSEHNNSESQQAVEEEEVENKFAFQWISAIGRGTMTLYLQKIMEIPALSESGAKQLDADINYIINLLSMLGITIDKSLEIAHKYIKLPREQFDYRGAEVHEQQIAAMIAKMRSIK